MTTKEKAMAKKATHTPGPWDVSRWGKAGFEIQGGSKSLAIVNKVQETRNTFLEADSSAKQRRNESTIEQPNYDTSEALLNAQLMAAAPVMYETLKTCLAFMAEIDVDAGPVATIMNHLEHGIRVAEGKAD